jgi:translation initiation factor eIF-2B subunit delta
MTGLASRPTPAWWPPDAVACMGDLVSYRLVGASACADRISSALASVAAESQTLRRTVVTDVVAAGELFCALKPDTALYRNIARVLERAAADGAESVREMCDRLSRSREAAQCEVVQVAVEALADAETLLVHDYSSMVLRILESLSPSRRVVVTAGEPLGQGARVARLLAAAGHAVVFTPDMSVGRVIDEVDAFVTGVESFYRDGSMTNTVGSLALGLLCRYAAVPVVAPAELLKCDVTVAAVDRAHLDARLLSQWPTHSMPDQVEVVDFVLDPVPAELVTLYATEAGAHTPSAVGAHAETRLAEFGC